MTEEGLKINPGQTNGLSKSINLFHSRASACPYIPGLMRRTQPPILWSVIKYVLDSRATLSISRRQFEVVVKDWKVHSIIISSYHHHHPIQLHRYYFAESRSPKSALIPVLMQRCNVFLSFSASSISHSCNIKWEPALLYNMFYSFFIQ